MTPWNALWWSIRREWWENRAIQVAPLVIAALSLAGFMYFSARLAHFVASHPGKDVNMAAVPFGMAASIILLTGWIVGFFYAADALHGERRDRSILFWKSMPVSDLVTVAAKAAIPLVAIPLFTCAVAIVTQLAMLVAGPAIAAAAGGDAATLWNAWPMVPQTLVMLYGMAIHALWFAPIYAWLLLVSAWAKRAVLLWAFLPLFALFALEKVALGTSWLASAIQYRLVGATAEGFARGALKHPITALSQLDPARFFSTPNMWLGLVFAAACFALAVRLRRYGEPT
jgi:ABC-2 type transport system permease protein